MPAPSRPTVSSPVTRMARDGRRLRLEVGPEEQEHHEVLTSGIGGLVLAGRRVVSDHQLVAAGLAAAHLVPGEPALPGPGESAVDTGLAQPVDATGRDDETLPGVLA